MMAMTRIRFWHIGQRSGLTFQTRRIRSRQRLEGNFCGAGGERPGRRGTKSDASGKPDYQKQLSKELAVIGNSEMWQAGKAVRALRPKEPARAIAAGTKGISGRGAN